MAVYSASFSSSASVYQASRFLCMSAQLQRRNKTLEGFQKPMSEIYNSVQIQTTLFVCNQLQ